MPGRSHFGHRIADTQSTGYLRSHLIEPKLLLADSFEAFLADRQKRLLALIEHATGKAAYVGNVEEEGQDFEVDEDSAEAELTIRES